MRGPLWTPDEELTLQQLHGQKPLKVIAGIIGRTHSSVKRRATKLRLYIADNYWTDSDNNYLLQFWGVTTVHELAAKFKTTVSAIRQQARKIGLYENYAEKQCECGCGQSFTPTVANQLYIDRKHRDCSEKYKAIKRRWFLGVKNDEDYKAKQNKAAREWYKKPENKEKIRLSRGCFNENDRRQCACGCGESFIPRSQRHQYINRQHHRKSLAYREKERQFRSKPDRAEKIKKARQHAEVKKKNLERSRRPESRARIREWQEANPSKVAEYKRESEKRVQQTAAVIGLMKLRQVVDAKFQQEAKETNACPNPNPPPTSTPS